MLVKATVSFSGAVSMAADEVKDIDASAAKELLNAGYVVEVNEVKKTAKTAKKAK